MKGLCPDCSTMHRSDEPCPPVKCPRCSQTMDSAEEAEGCEDWSCPMPYIEPDDHRDEYISPPSDVEGR